MPSVILTEVELDYLAGLPHASIALYLALRRRMDGGTGLVGAPHLVSWQAIKEAVYVEPRPGVGSYAPSRFTLLRSAHWLVRAGLVEMRSNAKQHQLIVKMLLAPVRSLGRNQPAPNPHHNPHASPHRGNPQKPARHPPREPAPHLSSILPTVAGADGGADLKSVERPKLAWLATYPQGYSQDERRQILQVAYANHLDADTVRLMLDELTGAERKAPVRSRPALFQTFVKQHRRGIFFASKAMAERSNGVPLSEAEIEYTNEGNPNG